MIHPSRSICVSGSLATVPGTQQTVLPSQATPQADYDLDEEVPHGAAGPILGAFITCPFALDTGCTYTDKRTQRACSHINKHHMDRLPSPGRARIELVNRLLKALRSTDSNGVTLQARFCDRCLTFYADSTDMAGLPTLLATSLRASHHVMGPRPISSLWASTLPLRRPPCQAL